MDLLLDSHVALWWAHDPDELGADAAQLIAAAGNEVWVSAASAWELAIKVRSGRLDLDVDRLFDSLASHGFRILASAWTTASAPACSTGLTETPSIACSSLRHNGSD